MNVIVSVSHGLLNPIIRLSDHNLLRSKKENLDTFKTFKTLKSGLINLRLLGTF